LAPTYSYKPAFWNPKGFFSGSRSGFDVKGSGILSKEIKGLLFFVHLYKCLSSKKSLSLIYLSGYTSQARTAKTTIHTNITNKVPKHGSTIYAKAKYL
jgi:hypothetical protein